MLGPGADGVTKHVDGFGLIFHCLVAGRANFICFGLLFRFHLRRRPGTTNVDDFGLIFTVLVAGRANFVCLRLFISSSSPEAARDNKCG